MSSLTQKTADGFAWLLGLAVVTQVMSLVQLVILGTVLEKSAFDLLALTYTVTVFASLLQQGGLSQALVQKHEDMPAWVNAGFWLSLTLGLAAGLLVLAMAWPLANGFYHRPELTGVMAVASLSMPLSALATVPDAQLRVAMRFRDLAIAGVLGIFVQVALAIGLALGGAGAYALVVPPVVGVGLRCGWLWVVVRPQVHRRLEISRWPGLLSSSTLVLIGAVAMAVTYQASSIILGWRFPAESYVAVFYFAWNLSDQGMRLIVNNLQQVLFPSLRSLAGTVDRQAQAFLRATRLLMYVGVPIAAAQAIVAEPLLRLVWGDRWLGAAPVMTALSVGMVSRLVFGPSEALMLAQQRNRAYMLTTVSYAVCFVSAVAAGAEWGALLGTAWASAACMLVLTPVVLYIALRPARTGWWSVLRIVSKPVVFTLACAIPAVVAVRMLDGEGVLRDVAACGVTALIFVVVYPLLLRTSARAEWDELLERVGRLIRRGRGARSTAAGPTGPA